MGRIRRNGWKGHCLMCAFNKGKVRGLPLRQRKPASEIRRFGKRRRIRRKGVYDDMEY